MVNINSDKSFLFTTNRLGFRGWTDRDIPTMAAISADAKVMEFFPDLATYAQTEEFVRRMQRMQDERGHCYFAVDLLESGELIGFIGLCYQDYEAAFTPCVDIGWRLATKFWGIGLATEGAQRCLSYAFDDLKLKSVLALAPRINHRSVNVMKKIGMQLKFEYQSHRVPTDSPLKDFVCYEGVAG